MKLEGPAGPHQDGMRGLPAVHRFLSDPRIAAYETLLGREIVKSSVTAVLDDVRRAHGNGSLPPFDVLAAAIAAKLEDERFSTLVPVINGTGVLLHTNLGRAPLAVAAVHAIAAAGTAYSNIEYDLATGKRGSRYARVTSLLRSITGAQDALVVNNCAAAVLLVLDTFAKGREVVVARNQLVEVGGGFRLPDVLARSGARLIEVGATNKVYAGDFARALSPRTALLLRSHASNFRMIGFTEDVDPRQLVELGRRAGVPVVEDLGSGALVDLSEYGLPHERTVQDAVADGIELVAFSADKVLGGPQAGVIVGKSSLIARLRNNPLLRALRVDKLTLAALSETLRIYASPDRRGEIPFFAMLSASIAELRERAQRYREAIPQLTIIGSVAYAGGGTLPQSEVRSVAVALVPAIGANAFAGMLRRRRVPIIARVEQNSVLLDLRTIFPSEDAEVIAALQTSGA